MDDSTRNAETLLQWEDDKVAAAWAHAPSKQALVQLERGGVWHAAERLPHERVHDVRIGPNHASWIGVDAQTSTVVVAGAAQAELRGVVPSTFAVAPDGRRWACVARDGDRKFLVVDGEEQTTLDGDPPGAGWNTRPLVFKPDSSAVLFGGKRDGSAYLFADGELASEPFDMVRDATAAVGRTGCRARRDGSWFVVVDDVVFGPYEVGRQPVFSPNGRHAGFLFEDDEGAGVMVDGEVVARHEDLGLLMLLGDDGSFAYQAEDDDGEFLVVNGEPQRHFSSVRGLVRGPGPGARCGAVGVDGSSREYAVFGSDAYGPFHSIDHHSLKVSADGQSLLYLVLDDDQLHIDGHPVAQMDGFYDFRFDDAGMAAIGVRGSQIVWEHVARP